jgi:hypothetical protein
MESVKNRTLCFTRYAWKKITHLNSLSTAEVGAFGISDANNLFLVEDIAVIKQEVTGASVSFDDEAIADYFLDQVELGRKPEQFARIWIHTHPSWFTQINHRISRGGIGKVVPLPSALDETTFEQAFGKCNWAIMFIYGSGSSGYARLSLRKRKRQIILSVTQGNGKIPTEADMKEWEQEFEQNVTEKVIPILQHFGVSPLTVQSEYPQLENMVDTDIDVDEFARYLESLGDTVESFCQYNDARRQWWINEFRKDREFHPRIINPYF